MSAKIIDGKALAQSVRTSLKEKVEQFKLSSRAPGLTVILVGDNPASPGLRPQQDQSML